MGDKSAIEWTDATWSPIVGCSRVSPGCQHCYAEALAYRLAAMGQKKYEGLTRKVGGEIRWTGAVRLAEEALDLPLRWKKPRRIFVNSMSDLFHEKVEGAWMDRIFSVMAACQQHQFQVLTKRARRMEIFTRLRKRPLPNVWLGVSVENQETADERIPVLLRCPAAVRFLSVEPLLGPVDLDGLWGYPGSAEHDTLSRWPIHWVIVGGESGPGYRHMQTAWLEAVVGQCRAAKVPVFVKQDSGPKPGKQGFIPDALWARKELPR
jgi:protein gp37